MKRFILSILLFHTLGAFASEPFIPKNCTEKKVDTKIQFDQVPCDANESDFTLKIKESYLSNLNSALKNWAWVETRLQQLINLRTFELRTYKPLYQHLAFDDPATDKIKIQYKKFKNDFDLLLETAKEIDIALRQINILQKDKIGYIAPDLFEKYKQLQALKMSILNRNPILGGDEIEKLIKNSIEKDNTPSTDKFKEALKADLQIYLLNQRDSADTYKNFKIKSEYQFDRSGERFKKFTNDFAASNFEIIQDIFKSGIADDDFTDPLFSSSACEYLEKMHAAEKVKKIKRTAIETSLFVAPFLVGEMGLVSRFINFEKALQFGSLLTKETATMIPKIMSTGFATLSLGLNAKEIYNLKESCNAQYGSYGLKPSQERYEALRGCKEEYDTSLMVSAAGVGAISGVWTFKNLSPSLRSAIVKNLNTQAKSESVLQWLVKDFGVDKSKQIKRELDSIKKITIDNKSQLSSFSEVVKNKERAVDQFILERKISKDIDGHKVIPKADLNQYTEVVGKDSIEILFVPGADAPYLPESINKVGHMAMRIGDKVYHQTGGSGFKIESFDNFINSTKRDFKVYGTVLQVSPKEQEVMKKFFTQMHEKQLPYSFLFNNCSQASCLALELSAVKKISSGAIRRDPFLTNTLLKRSERAVLKTAYNIDEDLSVQQLKLATARNRAAFYGVPLAAAAGTGYASVEAVDFVIDYVNKIQEP